MEQGHSEASALPHLGTPLSLRQARAVAASILRDTSANPAPLGLMGFGVTTILLNLHNVGLLALSSPVLALGIASGGIAQVVAGLMEWKKRNTFGTVAFTAYGLFWLSLVALLVMPRFGLADATDRSGMAAYLFVWGLFTVVLFVATLKMNRAVMIVFFALTILFFLLAIADATGSATLQRVAGYEGILCGLGAIYIGAAQILNEVWGRTLLPLGTIE
ncbi:MAG TPA: acetate uptake transporter [Anaeromyxobacter sp.]